MSITINLTDGLAFTSVDTTGADKLRSSSQSGLSCRTVMKEVSITMNRFFFVIPRWHKMGDTWRRTQHMAVI